MYAVENLAKLTRASSKGDDVVINDVNPGMVVSEAMREWTGVKYVFLRLLQMTVMRSTEVGSRTLLNAVEGGKDTHGQYMDDCRIGK